ncbi:matrixin family metalloprotease [Chloroflexota bacterium]
MRKVIVALLVMAILVLSFPPSMVLAESEKKPITPPELKSITFIHYAKPDKPPGKPDKPDEPPLPEPDNSAYVLLGIYLTDTVTYQVNPDGAPEGVLAEIQSSFETWDTETGNELFIFSSLTNQSGLNLDGQNTVSWRRIAPRSTIAVTRLWYDTVTGQIVEFDIAFNAFLKWGIDPDDEGPISLSKQYDVQNIATHEVGHVVGLADLYEDQYRELTMYGYGRTGEVIKISLEEGDMAGARYLYGAP